MGVVLASTSLEVISIFLLICWSIYRYFTKHYDFWKKRGVPYIKPVFPFGSLKDFAQGRIHMGEAYHGVYKRFPDDRFCGVVELRRPVLVIRDPDLIKQILIKDFNSFVDRAPMDVNPNEAIDQNLFFLEGSSWRNMRHKLTSAFTSGKMKNMFSLAIKCSDQMRNCLIKMTETPTAINVKEMSTKFTMDVIATCAFGIEMNSFSGEHTEFYKTSILFFQPTVKFMINQRIISFFPLLAQMLGIERVMPEPKKLLHSVVSNTVKFREENRIVRKDFIDILINLKQNKSILDETEKENESEIVNNDKEQEGLTFDQMTAQAFIFFAAGFETSSSTMTFCLFELAQLPNIQDRVCQELERVLQKYDNQITYQSLQEMIYLEQVINETMRRYPSLTVLHRRCTEAYRIPNSDLLLEKGQKICIPVYGIHHDPQYYSDPFKFDPERFTQENVKTRHPCLHLPFGAGPRNCIGMRFGMMQTKIGLATFLSMFKVEVAPETIIPMEFFPRSFVIQPKDQVFLKVSRR